MPRLGNSLDAHGGILDFDETFRILETHVVPVDDEDNENYMLTDCIQFDLLVLGEFGVTIQTVDVLFSILASAIT